MEHFPKTGSAPGGARGNGTRGGEFVSPEKMTSDLNPTAHGSPAMGLSVPSPGRFISFGGAPPEEWYKEKVALCEKIVLMSIEVRISGLPVSELWPVDSLFAGAACRLSFAFGFSMCCKRANFCPCAGGPAAGT